MNKQITDGLVIDQYGEKIFTTGESVDHTVIQSRISWNKKARLKKKTSECNFCKVENYLDFYLKCF